MIKHLLRQEKQGGFWLLRNAGRAVELSDSEFKLFVSLHQLTMWDDGSVDQLAQQLSPEVKLLFYQQDLHMVDRWPEVRVIALDAPTDSLSNLATVAPKRIYFEITRFCNLSCRSCFNNSRHKLPNELSLEEIIDINRQAQAMGVFEIRYTGGECTQHPHFPEIVADARERGFYISIGTNGIYNDEQLAWLPNSGIDWFIISLDGNEERNDQVRGKGSYQQVLKTLEHLSDNPKIRLRLNMVVAKHNVEQIRDVAMVAERFNVSSLNLIPLRPYGRSTKRMTEEMFAQQDFYNFIHVVNGLRKDFPSITFSTTIDLLDPDAVTSHDLIVQKKKTCAAGVEGVVIGPQGHVYGCSYSPASFPDTADETGKKVFIAGNIREDSLKTIWRDDSRWQVFRNLDLYKNQKCHSCDHYTVRCSGSCQIMSYYQMQHKQAVEQGQALGEYLDPYCFVDLYDKKGSEIRSKVDTPCQGAGMDGF